MTIFKKWIPLLFLICVALVFYAYDLERYFNFSTLQQYHHDLRSQVTHHFFLSLCVFVALYIVVAATALPIAAFITILGGYLFGPFISLILIDISATLGAIFLFLTVKTTFGEILREKANPWVQKMERGFQTNAFSYLLFLRLVPLFPFWIVTIASAFLGVNLRSFFLATLIGIIPGIFVYALLGDGLGALLEQGKTPDIYVIFKPAIFLPLCGLAFFSLIPVLYKKGKKRDES